MIGEYEIKCYFYDLIGDMENVKYLKVCDKYYVSLLCRGYYKFLKGKSLLKFRSDVYYGNLKVNLCIVVSFQCGSEVCFFSGIFCKKYNVSVFNDLINYLSLFDCVIVIKLYEEMEYILIYQEEKYIDEFFMVLKLNVGIFI